jgi:hypothetical protein
MAERGPHTAEESPHRRPSVAAEVSERDMNYANPLTDTHRVVMLFVCGAAMNDAYCRPSCKKEWTYGVLS